MYQYVPKMYPKAICTQRLSVPKMYPKSICTLKCTQRPSVPKMYPPKYVPKNQKKCTQKIFLILNEKCTQNVPKGHLYPKCTQFQPGTMLFHLNVIYFSEFIPRTLTSSILFIKVMSSTSPIDFSIM